jgi:hypothetical protein
MYEGTVRDGLLEGCVIRSRSSRLPEHVVLEYPVSRCLPPTHRIVVRWDRARQGYLQHHVQPLSTRPETERPT